MAGLSCRNRHIARMRVGYVKGYPKCSRMAAVYPFADVGRQGVHPCRPVLLVLIRVRSVPVFRYRKPVSLEVAQNVRYSPHERRVPKRPELDALRKGIRVWFYPFPVIVLPPIAPRAGDRGLHEPQCMRVAVRPPHAYKISVVHHHGFEHCERSLSERCATSTRVDPPVVRAITRAESIGKKESPHQAGL